MGLVVFELYRIYLVRKVRKYRTVYTLPQWESETSLNLSE